MNGAKEPDIERWRPSSSCCDPTWEEAYRRFETPDEEVEKFRRRLLAAGAAEWNPDFEIAELCCGRGNGLQALASLGFARLRGVDLSEELLRTYTGPARLYLGDCRDLQFPERSLDVVIVQGGLHHLVDTIPDLDQTLRGVRRVLRSNGRLVVVEPWRTRFLTIVLAAIRLRAVRRLSNKADALATMVEREQDAYLRWLSKPDAILALLHDHFVSQREKIGWGTLTFVGSPRTGDPHPG